jgi:hypothetical protein
MKTTKILSVLSFALIFVGMAASFATNNDGLNAKAAPVGITYKVMIHSDIMSPPSGTYLIQILDERGRLVASPQVWVPGVNIYTFKEKFSAAANPGARRVAKLVSVKGPYLPNSSPISAAPDVRVGPFLSGNVYIFNLYLKSVVRDLD